MKQYCEWLKVDLFYSTIKRICWKSSCTRGRAITLALLPAKSCKVWRNDLPLPETCSTPAVALKVSDSAMVPDAKIHSQGLARAQRVRASVWGETWLMEKGKGLLHNQGSHPSAHCSSSLTPGYYPFPNEIHALLSTCKWRRCIHVLSEVTQIYY